MSSYHHVVVGFIQQETEEISIRLQNVVCSLSLETRLDLVRNISFHLKSKSESYKNLLDDNK